LNITFSAAGMMTKGYSHNFFMNKMLFVIAVPKYLNFASFSKDLLAVLCFSIPMQTLKIDSEKVAVSV
jgi:hypothetical protein